MLSALIQITSIILFFIFHIGLMVLKALLFIPAVIYVAILACFGKRPSCCK